jgi:hypothetical protein
MSVEQDTVPGILKPVNTFYVSLLVPVENPRHATMERARPRPLSRSLICKGQIV